jgi:hypothetical protein
MENRKSRCPVSIRQKDIDRDLLKIQIVISLILVFIALSFSLFICRDLCNFYFILCNRVENIFDYCAFTCLCFVVEKGKPYIVYSHTVQYNTVVLYAKLFKKW